MSQIKTNIPGSVGEMRAVQSVARRSVHTALSEFYAARGLAKVERIAPAPINLAKHAHANVRMQTPADVCVFLEQNTGGAATCHGTSIVLPLTAERQRTAALHVLVRAARREGLRVFLEEGSDWAVADIGVAVVHVIDPEVQAAVELDKVLAQACEPVEENADAIIEAIAGSQPRSLIGDPLRRLSLWDHRRT